MDPADSTEEQVDEPGDEGVCGLPSGELSSADIASGWCKEEISWLLQKIILCF